MSKKRTMARWSEAEKETARRMVLARKPVREIAEKLQRNPAQIYEIKKQLRESGELDNPAHFPVQEAVKLVGIPLDRSMDSLLIDALRREVTFLRKERDILLSQMEASHE